jgi:hypothetical protein
MSERGRPRDAQVRDLTCWRESCTDPKAMKRLPYSFMRHTGISVAGAAVVREVTYT